MTDVVVDTVYTSRIKNLEELLQSQIGKSKRITNVEEIDFLGQGENYGSTIFRLTVTLKDENNDEEEIIETVAKMLPATEEARKMFDVQNTVEKEIAFYNKIVPTLSEFLKESGFTEKFDMFPKLFGARINLNGGNIVDDDAVIVLENLITSGYNNVNRLEGFDYETTKLILKDLALYHAAPLAFKLKKPEIFEKEIKPLLFLKFDVEPPEKKPDEEPYYMKLVELLYQNDKCLPYGKIFKERFENEAEDYLPPPPEEPWGTLVHGDLWVNNLMVRFEDGKPVSNKFVDFQIFNYNSFVGDVIFLIWSSVQQQVIESSFDELLRYYYDNFILILKQFDCDTEPFKWSSFLEHVSVSSKNEFLHIVFFFFVVFGNKNKQDSDDPFDFTNVIKHFELKGKEKFWYAIQFFGKRGWI